MKFTFLGTAAAFGYPELFCNCDDCTKARTLGGKNSRKRCSALINDDLLIDLGPDIIAASQMYSIPLANVKYCLQTHPHPDHIDASHLLSRDRDIGIVGASQMHMYASLATLEYCDELFKKNNVVEFSLFDPEVENLLNIKLHPVEAFQPFMCGPYRVTAVPANHAPGLGAFLFAVEQDGRTIFYGTDTDQLAEEVWQGFHTLGLKFDLVVLDHTNGIAQPGFGHMNAQLVAEHVQRMVEEDILKQGGEVYITHISHQRNPIHAELSELVEPNGCRVAFDGLVIDLNDKA